MYFDLEGIPELKKGEIIKFRRALNFGDFKARLFVVEDRLSCLFKVDNAEGKVVKILPSMLRVTDWQVVGRVALKPLPPITTVSEEIQLTLFECVGGG